MKYSIIIPTYNHLEDCLRPCIESIIQHTDLQDVDIQVVANGCTDGTADYVRSKGFFCLESKEPMGFTKAVNWGLENVDTDYVVILNNDTQILGNHWLDMLEKPFREDFSVGITGAAKNYHEPTEHDFLLFFCVMLSRKTIEKVGKLDEIFNPGYGEDIDYCFKVRRNNMRAVQVPNDVNLKSLRDIKDHTILFPIWHKSSQTVHAVPGWTNIVDRNEKILLNRYKKLDAYHAYSMFDQIPSDRITPTIDRITSQLKEEGQVFFNLNDRTTVTLGKGGFIHGLFPGRENMDKLGYIPSPFFSMGADLKLIKDLVLACGTKSIAQFGGTWEGGYATQQDPDEISQFLFDHKDNHIENYLEIGAAEGGVTRLICDVMDVKNVTHIDLGWGDMNHPYTYRKGIERLKNTGKIDIFRGDSTSKQAKEFLGDRKFDMIFIDGDHSYEGVLKDTEMAMKHATDGALFIYHDHEAVQDVGRIYTEIRDGQFPELTFEKEYISDNPITRKGISVFRYNSVPIEDKSTKKEDSKISIVIPTYNHLEDALIPCIESIEKYTSMEEVEIIVVANGCAKDTIAYLSTKLEKINLSVVVIDEPVGFIKATNAGIKEAKGEFIVLLNNDTELLPQEKDTWLKMLSVPFMDDKVGITGPYKDWRFFWQDSRLVFREEYMVFYCAMIRKKVFDEIGLLDEDFGAGYEEDIDFAIRAKQAGWKIVQVPEDMKDELNITKEFLVDFKDRCNDFPMYHKDKVTFKDVNISEIENGSRTTSLLNKWKKIPKYSIIIPTYNHLEDLLHPCLVSIAEHTDLSEVEVIIVANGCTDQTREYVHSLGHPFKLLWIDEQVGYIKATNAGIKQAMGDYIILLNNDVEIKGKGWIDLLRDKAHHSGLAGVVKSHRGDVKRDYLLFWCVMIKREVFENIGVLDEQFGLGYHEDVDFCIRAENYGYQLAEVDIPIIHKGGGTFAPIFGDSPERLDKHKQKLYDKYSISKPKVYDCFTFFNELDVLGIRLEELWDVVDHFVLVEARETHQGQPKKLFFGETKEAKQRFIPYISKIRHIVIEKFPDWCVTTWDREHYQRNYIHYGLHDAKDNDIIILSDADEILKADTVRNYNPEMGVAAVEMPLFYYKLDWKLDEKWYKPRIFPFSATKGKALQDFRGGNDYDYQHIIPNGGWHFSFLGDKDSIKYKIQSYAHDEFNNDSITNDKNIQEAIEQGRDVFGRDLHFKKVEIDYTYPYWVVENLQYYIDKGLVSKPILSKEFIDACIYSAEKEVSKMDKGVLNIMSMLNERTRHLMNNLGSFGGNYLEVGSWHGGSVCSMLSNNTLKSVTVIDDFSEFQPTPEEAWLGDRHSKDVLIENLERYNNKYPVKLIEGDFYKTDLKGLEPIDIYFYDGGHDYESQYQALKYALPTLADTFVFIVDDYHWPEVNQGTNHGINELIAEGKITCLHQRELLSETPPKEAWPDGWQRGLTNLAGEWRNGVYIGLFKKVQSNKPKVYDCFSFFNELDILEIRLNELDPYVDYFVISEMRQTHSGLPKPLNFELLKYRFSKYLHKITYLVPPDIQVNDPWEREHYQRDYIKSFLQTVCKDDDWIIVSDLDEIPRGEKIKEYKGKGVNAFEQNQYSYKLNYNVGISPLTPGTFSRITNWGYMKKNNITMTGLRYLVLTEDMLIKDSGWHFSWMGGVDKIVEKLESWAHEEFNKPEFKDADKIHHYIHLGKEHFGREGVGETTPVEIDSTFPKYVQENKRALLEKNLLTFYTKAKEDKVAIVMPYYNDPFLTKSVAAIMGQTFKNWKLFIVDDGSKKVACHVLAAHPQIYHIRQYNQGPSAARNAALRTIREQGDFTHIAFCDSDDIWNPNYLMHQLKAIGDSQIVYCSVNEQFDNGETAYPWGIPDPPEYPGREVMLATPFIYISSVVCKRECLPSLKFDSRLDSIEDWDMWLTLDEAGFKFKKNHRKLLTYTVKTGNNMAGKRTEEKTNLLKEKHGALSTVI